MALDVEMLTVGAIGENCFLVRREGSDRVLIVDPGEEAERILATLEDIGGKAEAILVTHCHFDHIGAVAPVAAATGAPVYCPEIELPILADIMAYVPWEGFGPFESYEADEPSTAARPWSWPGSSSTSSSPPATAPATSPTRCATRTRSSPATSSSRARSAVSTCHSATARR